MGYYEDYLVRAGKATSPTTTTTTTTTAKTTANDPYKAYLIRAAKAGVQIDKNPPKVETTTPTVTPTTTPPATVTPPVSNNTIVGNLPPTTLSAARPKNFVQKIGDWFKETFGQEDAETTRALAQNAYALKKQYPEETEKYSLSDLAEPGGNILKNSPAEQVTKDVGIRNNPTTSELTNSMMTLSLATALVEVPLFTLASMGVVTAVNMVKSNLIAKVTGQPLSINNNQTLSDLAPDASPLAKNTLDLIDFFGTVMILGYGIKKGLKSKNIKGQTELTPDQAQEIITKRGLEKTEFGKTVLNAAEEGRATGKNLDIQMGAEVKSPIAKVLKVDTPQSLNMKIDLVEPGASKVATTNTKSGKPSSLIKTEIPATTEKTPPIITTPKVGEAKVSPKVPTTSETTSPKAPETTKKTTVVSEEVVKKDIVKNTVDTLKKDATNYKTVEEFSNATHTVPLNSIEVKQSIIDETSKEAPSKTPDAPLVVLVRDDGTLVLQDGYHRYNQLIASGEKEAKIVFETPSDKNVTSLFEKPIKTKTEELTIAPSQATTEKEVIGEIAKSEMPDWPEHIRSKDGMYTKPIVGISELKTFLKNKEFAKNPIFTVIKEGTDKKLQYKSPKLELTIYPKAFGYNPEKLNVNDKIKIDIEKVLKSKGVQQTRVYKGGTVEADTGGYSNVESDRNKIENLRGFEFPELLQLYQTLTNSTPLVKAMRSYLGYHRSGVVALSTALWESDNPREAVLTFGHEIGHLTDFFPTKTMKRGNILGHIATLRGYLKHFLAEYPGAKGEITPQDRVRLRKEAVKQSKIPIMEEQWVTVGTKKATPQEILAIWNDTMAGEKMPELMDWIKRLSEAEKVQIVKGAIKGVLPEWMNFEVLTKEKQLREVVRNAPEDIKAKYQELLREEVLKRKLFTLTEIKKELVDLSQLWKPFDPLEDARYTKYRLSAKELYADALSVLFNDPTLLRQKAPIFNQAFFNYLDQKPEFSKAFFEAQTILLSGNDTVMSNRLGSIIKNYKTGNEKLFSIRAEAKNAKDNLVRMLDNAFNDVNSETNRRTNAAIKAGISIPDEINPIFTQSSLNYMDARVKNFMVDNVQPVVAKVANVPTIIVETNFGGKKETLTMNGFEAVGFVLQMERSINERGKFANPGGFAPKEATETLAYTQTKYKKSDWIKIKNGVRLMRKAVKKLNILAFEHGYRSAELTQQLLANKSYATFQVLDYLDTHITSAIYKQKGTLKGVANPALTTAMKMVSTLRAIFYNDAKLANIEFLKLTDPENITPSKLVWNGRAKVPVAPKDKNKVMALVVENGKLVGYDIDKELDYTFNKTDDTKMRQLGKIVKYITQAPIFRNIYITINLGYQMSNARRDFNRMWRNNPDKTVKEALLSFFKVTKQYAKAVPHAWKAATGKPDEIIREMEDLGILGLTRNDFYGLPDTVGEEYITASLQDLGVLPGLKETQGSALSRLSTKVLNKIAKTPILNIPGKLLEAVEVTGNFIERLPKVAGYQGLKTTMSEARLAHYVRNYLGSPDFLVQGSATPVTNNLLMFSNAAKEGFKGDYRQGFKQKETRGAWWFKMLLGTILPKLFQRAAKMGLLGVFLKKLYDNISEYDLANYNNYALSFDVNGKTVYIRDPNDETGRFVGALVWKITGIFDKDKKQELSESLMDVFAIYSSQVPSLSPGLEVSGAVAEYLAGRNPYDTFRGRNIISQTAFATKEFKYTFPEMLNWVKNQLGMSIILPNYTPKGDMTNLEKILNLPVLSNILGRFVKVSSQGQQEKATQIGENIAAISARKKALIDEEVANAIKEKRGVNLETALGHKVETAEDVAKSLQIIKQFQVEQLSGKDVYLDSLIYAQTNAAKVEILQDYQKNLPPEQYGALLIKAKDNGIISEDVLEKMIEAEKKQTSQGFQLVKPAYAADKIAFNGDSRQEEIYKKMSNEWTTGEASYYNPTNPKETREGTDGTGAYGRKVESGSVAFGNRVFHDRLKKGEIIYIQVKGFENVKTPYGNGIFRVDDTMNERYNQKGKFNIDFNPKDITPEQRKKGRYPIEFKIVEPNKKEKPVRTPNNRRYYA